MPSRGNNYAIMSFALSCECLSCHILLGVLESSVQVGREDQGYRICEGTRYRPTQSGAADAAHVLGGSSWFVTVSWDFLKHKAALFPNPSNV